MKLDYARIKKLEAIMKLTEKDTLFAKKRGIIALKECSIVVTTNSDDHL